MNIKSVLIRPQSNLIGLQLISYLVYESYISQNEQKHFIWY